VLWARVLNFFKSWCVKFYEEDWENNPDLKVMLRAETHLHSLLQFHPPNPPSIA
jgi:hypothetical protein